VFEAVDGRFDLVIFDPPFRWFAPRDPLEAASTDENYRTREIVARHGMVKDDWQVDYFTYRLSLFV
jgi:hypothetical protein